MSVFKCPRGRPCGILELLSGGVGKSTPELLEQGVRVLVPPRENNTGGRLSQSFDPDRWEQVAAQ
ncbi:MAG: hypothetical protein WBB68_01475 [Candidatus Moraniibacteriota bacterium]